ALAGNPARMSGVISTLLISPLRIFSLNALYSMKPGPESGARELKTSNIAPKNTRYQIRKREFRGVRGDARGGLRNPGSFLASGPSGTGRQSSMADIIDFSRNSMFKSGFRGVLADSAHTERKSFPFPLPYFYPS